nr:unnamed protein product [Callosobruchus analis]
MKEIPSSSFPLHNAKQPVGGYCKNCCHRFSSHNRNKNDQRLKSLTM